MRLHETVDLGNNWVAVNVPSYYDNSSLLVSHRCDSNSAITHRVQKNTHRRHGVRWRCTGCKTIAPKYVVAFMKLHKLHKKVNDNDS